MAREKLLKVDEAAERLRVSSETIRRMLRDGRLQGVKPVSDRAGWLIPESELERRLRPGGASESVEKAKAA
jgi:excisionase family DNA binding protein